MADVYIYHLSHAAYVVVLSLDWVLQRLVGFRNLCITYRGHWERRGRSGDTLQAIELRVGWV